MYNLHTLFAATQISMNPKILVVEDNLVNQQVISWLLKNMGHECDLVATGGASLQAVAKHEYSLVFMDLNIPNLDGCSASKLLREAGYTMPIIAVTAEDEPQDWQRCSDAGMNGYLTKPFSMADFQDVLKRWLPSNSEVCS